MDVLYEKWSCWKQMKYDYVYSMAVLTCDEKYVILAGGYNENFAETDDINVLTLDDDGQHKLQLSRIKCPHRGPHYIAKTGGGIMDRLLVYGYIRNMMKGLDIDILKIPLEIMDMITNWYNVEMMHWIQCEGIKTDGKEHYVIPVDDILNSLDDTEIL